MSGETGFINDDERRALAALRSWWLANRSRELSPDLDAYYREPATQALVEAAADLVHPPRRRS